MKSQARIFDPNPINELKLIDPMATGGLVKTVIDMFTTSVEESVRTMKIHLAKGKTEDLMNLAHTLKASSGNIGAMEFSQTCEELEKMAMYKSQDLKVKGYHLLRHLEEILPETLKTLAEARSSCAASTQEG